MKPRHRPGWTLNKKRAKSELLANRQLSSGCWPGIGRLASQSRGLAGSLVGGLSVQSVAGPLQGRGRTDGQMRAWLGVSWWDWDTQTRDTSRLAGLLRAVTGSAACSVGRVPRPRKPARSLPRSALAGCYRNNVRGAVNAAHAANASLAILSFLCPFLSLCVCIGSSDVACPPTAERRVGLGDAGCKHQACPAVVWWCASVVARGVRGVGGLGWCGGCQRREKHGSAPLIRQRAAGQCDGKSLVHVQHAARGAAASPDWLAHQDQPGSGAGSPQGLPR